MRKPLVNAVIVVPLLVLVAGCATDRYSGAGYSGAGYPDGGWYPAPASTLVPVPAQDTSRDGKRGNTPPGMDRTGAGPADGAILDPKGVVTKQPVLREQ